MAHLPTLAALGTLAVLGATAGVHLGQSAIAEIDPIYFTEAPRRLHFDPGQTSNSAWAPQVASPGSPPVFPVIDECIGCDDRMGQFPRPESLAAVEDTGAATILPIFQEPEADLKKPIHAAARPRSDLAMLEGYDRYPVTGRQAVHAAVDVSGGKSARGEILLDSPPQEILGKLVDAPGEELLGSE